jgi:hypothetical protein
VQWPEADEHINAWNVCSLGRSGRAGIEFETNARDPFETLYLKRLSHRTNTIKAVRHTLDHYSRE